MAAVSLVPNSTSIVNKEIRSKEFSDVFFICKEKLYPLELSPLQLSTIRNKDRVIKLFDSKVEAPSKKAGLSEKGLCELIIYVDAVFYDSVKQYQDSIKQATTKDIKTTEALEANPKVKIWKTLDDYLLNPVIGGVCNIWKQFMGPSELVKREGSAFRFACLVEIGVLEEKRLLDMKRVIVEGAKPILSRLKTLMDRGECDTELLNHLKQLSEIYQSEFNKPLKASECNVAGFLEEIKTRYPDLSV